MMKSISVVVIDEHPLLAEGVVQALRAAGGFSIVGVGATSKDAIVFAREKRPGLMILEVTIAGGGLETARLVAQISPETKIVFLTSSEGDDDVCSALRDGAKGYILKGVEKAEFTKILSEIGNGRIYVNPGLAARMLGRARGSSADADASGGLSDLTNREKEIIEHVALGKTNKEVAGALRLGEKTVKHHMTSIMQKLQVRNRLEAALVLRERMGTVATPSGAVRPAQATNIPTQKPWPRSKSAASLIGIGDATNPRRR